MCVVIFSTYIFQLSIAFEYSPRRHGPEREWAILMSDYRQFRTPPSLTVEYVVLLFSLVMTDEKKKSEPKSGETFLTQLSANKSLIIIRFRFFFATVELKLEKK